MNNLMDALLITVVGMGLVFGAILLLWGLMALLVRLTPEKEKGQEMAATGAETDMKLRAAIAAVAVALAEDQPNEPHEFPLPPTPLVTAWQAVMRSKMLSKRGPVR